MQIAQTNLSVNFQKIFSILLRKETVDTLNTGMCSQNWNFCDDNRKKSWVKIANYSS